MLSTLNDKKTIKVIAQITPDNASDMNVIWTSDTSSVIVTPSDTTTNATITIPDTFTGVANITAKTHDGNFTDVYTIDRGGVLEDFELSSYDDGYELTSDTFQLTPVLAPSNAKVNITYASSDSAHITVDNTGLCTIIDDDFAQPIIITATDTLTGITATATVTPFSSVMTKVQDDDGDYQITVSGIGEDYTYSVYADDDSDDEQ